MSRKEDPEFAQMVCQLVRALGRRVGEGNFTDMELFSDVRQAVDVAEQWAVDGLREQGYSWADIADAARMTRQSAHEKWHTKRQAPPDTKTNRSTTA